MKKEKTPKSLVEYQLERDKITLKFSVLLVFVGTTAAGAADKMIEDSFFSMAAIIGVCACLLLADRGIRWLVSRHLNRKAEKNGDPIPFGKKNM